MNEFKEEKMQILKMVEEGKITAAEAMDLIDALGNQASGVPSKGSP